MRTVVQTEEEQDDPLMPLLFVPRESRRTGLGQCHTAARGPVMRVLGRRERSLQSRTGGSHP